MRSLRTVARSTCTPNSRGRHHVRKERQCGDRCGHDASPANIYVNVHVKRSNLRSWNFTDTFQKSLFTTTTSATEPTTKEQHRNAHPSCRRTTFARESPLARLVQCRQLCSKRTRHGCSHEHNWFPNKIIGPDGNGALIPCRLHCVPSRHSFNTANETPETASSMKRHVTYHWYLHGVFVPRLSACCLPSPCDGVSSTRTNGFQHDSFLLVGDTVKVLILCQQSMIFSVASNPASTPHIQVRPSKGPAWMNTDSRAMQLPAHAKPADDAGRTHCCTHTDELRLIR